MRRFLRETTPMEWIIVAMIVGIFAVIVWGAIEESKKPPCIRWSEPRVILVPQYNGKTTVYVPTTVRDCLERAHPDGPAEDPNQRN